MVWMHTESKLLSINLYSVTLRYRSDHRRRPWSEVWYVCESFKKRRSESIRLPGSCLHCEYWIMWFMNVLWILLYLFHVYTMNIRLSGSCIRAFTVNIRLSGSCICFDYWIFCLEHMLWRFVYLGHAYSVNFRLFGSCICYEYWVIWIMHRLWMLYSRSLQRSRLRVKSTGTLHNVTECALPDVAKGHVTFFTVSSLGSVDSFDP